MPARKADVEKIWKEKKRPYAKRQPPKETAVGQANRYAKDQKLHPAQRENYVPPKGKKLNLKKFMEEVKS